MQQLIWQCGKFTLDLSRPQVMGILNITPDSFSDGGQFIDAPAAIARAHEMIAAGVDIIDIGGESTRPDAQPLSACNELRRIMPIIDALKDCGKPLSIDTYKPYVMREALNAGADIINDVHGFACPVSIDAVADSGCGLCVMHMQGTPQTMQTLPEYTDVAAEVSDFLCQQITRLNNAGIDSTRICIDPGIGFGKTVAHNIILLNHLNKLFEKTKATILIGASRKRLIGELTGKPPTERMAGSVAAALFAISKGAHIVRVHDVAQTVDALKVWHGLSDIQDANPPLHSDF